MIAEILEIAFGVALGLLMAEILTAIPVMWLIRWIWGFLGNDTWNGSKPK